MKYRGGLRHYARARRDVILWVKEDQDPNAFFTTMIDLYALPTDFPGYAEAKVQRDPYLRVKMLEQAFYDDVGDRRFLPYLQLHEFEALLLADAHKLDLGCPGRAAEARTLAEEAAADASPELINDGSETAPSKRIIRLIPEYDGLKTSAGPLVAQKIGLPLLRSKCPHFGEWLRKLEELALTPE